MQFTASQNLRFAGPVRCEYSDPGEQAAVIGENLETALKDQGYTVVQDDWYEIGYTFALARDNARYSIAVVDTAEPEVWMLQLVCTSEPGWLKQLFGCKAKNRDEEVYQIATAIHEVLKSMGFSQLLWQLDGFPDEATSSTAPKLPE